MASSSDVPFKVDRVPAVTEEIRKLAKRAKEAGILPELMSALKEVERQLRTNPVEWGDPQYSTKKKGGMVCHVIVPPIPLRRF